MEDLFNGAINEPNERIIDIGTNNHLKLSRKDPYGFWYVSLTKGPTPNDLSGSYTSVEEARKDIARYLEKSGRVIKTIK